MKKTLACLLVLCALPLSGCAQKRYAYDFFDTFDTYVQITAYARGERDFAQFAEKFHARMRELHALFDIYHDYSGVNNVKTINDNAGIAPVAVDPALIELTGLCVDMYAQTEGSVNIALGPVLALWSDARSAALDDPDAAYLPAENDLEAAFALCNIDDVIVDPVAGTIFLARKGMKIDLGAAAKGFAVELAARELADGRSFLISAGGNVLARIPKDSAAPDGWKVGIYNPLSEGAETELVDTLSLFNGSAVTSGDYQRYFMLSGLRHGHIIDPNTLMPARLYRQVTVIGEDSGVADILSTALFVLPQEHGRALALKIGYDAIWVYEDGQILKTY